MSLQHGQALWLLALLAPLVALLLVPLRKPILRVASLAIWDRVFGASPVHRYTRWLRLVLTIAVEASILTAIALSAAKVRWGSSGVAPARRILVVDCSAAMQVKEQDHTRFEMARRIANRLIASNSPEDQFLVISAKGRPEIACPWSADAQSLHRAIDSLVCGGGPGDLKSAMELAQAGCDRQTTICLISASTAGLTALAPPPNPVLFYSCAGEAPHENIGIAAMDVQRRGPGNGEFHVFLRVRSNAARPVKVPLEITLDGKLLGRDELSLAPAASIEKDYTYASDQPGQVKALLSCEDALAVDNQAVAALSPLHVGKAYLWSSKPDPFLTYALAVHREIELFEVNRDKIRDAAQLGGRGDLVIFNKSFAPDLPRLADLILIDPPANNAVVRIEGRTRPAGGLRPVVGHPLFVGVDWRDVVVSDAARIQTPAWAQTLLATADGLPLILAGREQGRNILIFTFDPSTTSVVTSRGYPILLANMLKWMRDGNKVNEPQSVELPEAGDLPLQAPAPPPWVQVAALPPAGASVTGLWHWLAIAAMILLLGEWFLYHYRYIE